MTGRRSQRLLTREELELWAFVTRQDQPLGAPLLHGQSLPQSSEQESQPVLGEPPTVKPCQQSNAPVEPPKSQSKMPLNGARISHAQAPTAFDTRVAKLIARGRQPLDARLDLHGLRQQDAYFALRQFIAQCQASGHRHVLIITGKGEKANDATDRDFWKAEQRGVLRRLVPYWLSEPEFRSVIVGFTESSPKHGGGGALYVTIRRRKLIGSGKDAGSS